MKQVLCTAQVWGTGPISKLSSILTSKTSKPAFCYINSVNNHYDYFIKPAGICHLIKSFEETGRYFNSSDCLVSVMHPELALLAKVCGIHVVYIDSLTWFWKIWDEVNLDYYHKFLELSDLHITPETLFQILKYANLYDLQWAAHLLSDVSIVQNIFPLQQCVIDILNLRSHPSINVGAIIDERFLQSHYVNPKQVVINIGGCPANPKYKEWVIEVFFRVAKAKPDFQFYVVEPTSRRKVIEKCDNLTIKNIPREKFIKLINSSERIFSPPGLTFLLENFYLGNTIFLLPPQHAGQVKNEAIILSKLPSLPALSWQASDLSTKTIIEHTLSQLANNESLDAAATTILDTWDNIHPRGCNNKINSFIQAVGARGAQQAAQKINKLTLTQ